MGIKVYIKTLGCPKNEVDSVELASGLVRSGFEIVQDPNKAEILLVNTCSFIKEARLESKEEIEKLIDLKVRTGNKKLGIIGCWAEMEQKRLLEIFPEADGIFGIRNHKKTVDNITSFSKTTAKVISIPTDFGLWHTQYNLPLTFPYAYVKISEGCDNLCSYCILPSIKGVFRSVPSKYILDYVKNLVDFGYKEIILVGQDTTRYGLDLYGELRMPWLLEEISKLDGDYWIRIMYAHPKCLTEGVINVMSNNVKVLPYLDMPIQHISNKLLKLMNRGVTAEQIRSTILSLKRRIPDISLRTTVMVGFPGEDEQDFDQLVTFIEEGWFDHLGVFIYSPEEGTPALSLPGEVDPDVANSRKEIIEIVQNEIACSKSKVLKGKVIPAVLERETTRESIFEGRTIYDAPGIDRVLRVRGQANIGEIIKARILETFEYELVGEIWK